MFLLCFFKTIYSFCLTFYFLKKATTHLLLLITGRSLPYWTSIKTLSSKILNFYFIKYHISNIEFLSLDPIDYKFNIFGLRIFIEVQYDIFKITSPKNIYRSLPPMTQCCPWWMIRKRKRVGLIHLLSVYPHCDRLFISRFEYTIIMNKWSSIY